jgi:cellulose biosynthesis protein BcsQ
MGPRRRVFTLASAKGGSGKTVLAATFATFLASLDKRVLLVDTDAATNGLSLFYLKSIVNAVDASDRPLKGLFEGSGPGAAPDVVELSQHLHLLPATFRFQNTESVTSERYREQLRSALDELPGEYDYIFIDAQAGSDEFAEVAMQPSISDIVVIVSEYDPMSAAGVERLKALFPASLEYSRTWILLNKMLPEFVKGFRDFLEIARYLSPIPWDADVVRAYSRRSLALDLVEGNDFTTAIVQTLRTMLDGADRDELEEWLSQRVRALREPIDQQLRETEAQLVALRAASAYAERAERLRSVLPLVAGIALIAAGGILTFDYTSSSASFRSVVVGLTGGLSAVFVAVMLALQARPIASRTSERRDEIRALERRVARLKILEDLEFEDLSRSLRRLE